MPIDPNCWVELHGVAPHRPPRVTLGTGTLPSDTATVPPTDGDIHVQQATAPAPNTPGQTLATFVYDDRFGWQPIGGASAPKVSAFFGRVPPQTDSGAASAAYAASGTTVVAGEAFMTSDQRHIHVWDGSAWVEQHDLGVGSTYTNIDTGNVFPLSV
jgi:hypothetical protein